MEFNLHKLNEATWVMIVLLFVFEVCASVLFIFSFSRDLFISTDWIKLLFLGLSITLPIWIINCLIFVGFSITDNPNDDHQLQAIAAAGSGLSFPILYIPILVRFFCTISIKTGVIVALTIQLLILIIGYIINKIAEKNKKTLSKSNV